MAGDKCPASMVKVARDQANAILQEAEKALAGAEFPQCSAKLQTAKEFIAEAGRGRGTSLETRNAYVRATYHAGQARLCPIVAGIEREVGKRKPPGRRSPRKKVTK